EEGARLEGFDSIPSLLPAAPAGTGLTAAQRRERLVAADLASAGLTEVLSFPFQSDADLDRLDLPADDARRRAVSVTNPLDADRPEMTTTLLTGLLDTVLRNMSRGSRDLSVFELGSVFVPAKDAPPVPVVGVDRRPDPGTLTRIDAALPDQPLHVAAVLAGARERSGWWGPGRPAGWADAVELARRICATAGVAVRVVAAELAPKVVERLGLPPRTAALELNLDALPERQTPTAPAISAFPPVHLDVALVVPDSVPAADVLDALTSGAGELLESLRLFDVYTGDQVPPGHRSLAFALVVRAPDRTLTAAEATA